MDFLADARRRAFSFWLRTGRLPRWARGAAPERKYNPWHDQDDGRFTFAGTGRYFGRGSSGQSARSTDARMSDKPKEPYGGYAGGGRGFNSGGADDTWTTYEEDAQRARNEAPPSRRTPDRTRQALPPAPRSAVRRARNRRNWSTIEANGYKWTFDETGLFQELEGTVTLNDSPRRSRSAQARAGGSDRRRTDDGGHWIPPRLNGPPLDFNHWAQDLNLNRGQYRLLEAQWYQAKRSGKEVRLKIQAVYPEGSRRPSYANVWFWIDGKPHSLQIPNERSESRHAKR